MSERALASVPAVRPPSPGDSPHPIVSAGNVTCSVCTETTPRARVTLTVTTVVGSVWVLREMKSE